MQLQSISELKQLTDRSEGLEAEYWQSTDQLDSAMETMCAFLNGEGGVVLFGVTDDGP